MPSISIQWPGVAGVGLAAAMDASTKLASSDCIAVDDVVPILHLNLSISNVGVAAVIPETILVDWLQLVPAERSILSKVVICLREFCARNLFCSSHALLLRTLYAIGCIWP